MILYHGTTATHAKQIMKHGFTPGKSYNWAIKSKKHFVYLSLAYAPFYSMAANKSKTNEKLALIKVEVQDKHLYPDDDFVMAALGKPVYTQKEINAVKLEDYKIFWKESLQYLGNAAAKAANIEIIGVREFDGRKLLYVCDPTITPINYKIMGEHYRQLTEWIYDGNKPEDFKSPTFR